MSLSISLGTVGYNNKILVSDRMFSLVKNSKVNTLELAKEAIISKGDKPKMSHKVAVQLTITHKNLVQKETITHKEEKVTLVLFLAGRYMIW